MTERDPAAEREWIRQARLGDNDAFLQLVALYERKLLFYIRRFERDSDRSLDILQDVWLTAWRSIGTLHTLEAFSVWIYRIAHGKVIATIRSELRRSRSEEQHRRLSNEVSAVDGSSDSVDLIHFALGRLSADHREVATLRFIEGMQVAEMADVIGCKEGTVKSRLHAAKLQLARIVKEQVYESPQER